ncbi:MAG: hypothetical protein FWF77_05980 [Defluviitaleaceae bacterium]|nr:hypothetical protein [Defluviitaleaceae bacterium]
MSAATHSLEAGNSFSAYKKRGDLMAPVHGMIDKQFEAYLLSTLGRLDIAIHEINEKGSSFELIKLRDEISNQLKKP